MNKQKYHHNNKHEPVLLEDTIRLLAPRQDESYLDLTAGYGGHAKAVLELTKSPSSMVLNDRDSEAIEHLADLRRAGAKLIHSDFLATTKSLLGQNRQFDMIFADLGASSVHFDKADRGFSFRESGPLDMRMDINQELSAEHVVNAWPKDKLRQILTQYGQQPRAAKIVDAIVNARPITTTTQLAEVVARAAPGGKRHPATKTFQAIRIAVNDELNQLSHVLPLLVDLLTEGGRLAIISFHSLEDRLVKQFFREESSSGYESRLMLLTKSAVLGNKDEHNPRARSARLRAVCKIKTKGGS